MTATASAPSRAASIAALSLLSLAVTCAFGAHTVFMPLSEVAKLALQLSDFQVSLVQGAAASIPVALLAIPIGRLVDRANRVCLLLAMAAIWTAGAFLTAAADGFALLFVARMLGGVGATFTLPIAISLAADFCAPDARGRALLLLSMGRIVGTALAFAIGGALLGTFAARVLAEQGNAPFGLEPWRAVLVLFGFASLALMLPLLALREPPRQELGDTRELPLGPALRAVWARRSLLVPLFVGQIAVTMANFAALVWSAPVLTRDYGLQPADFAGWMGLVLLLSGVIGSIAGGLSADWGYKGRIRGGILVGAIAAALLAIPAALFALMPSVSGFAWMLALLLTCGSVAGLVTAASISVLIPNDLRGICLGAFFVVAALAGTGLAPTLATLASDLFGGESQLRYGLSLVTVATSVIGAVAFIKAARAT